MEGTIYINGIIGEDYNLSDALLDVKKNKENDSIRLKIGSDGGFVDVAEQIYKLFANTGKITASENVGNVASAAVKLFLLAPSQNRTFDPSLGVFLIHNPFDDGMGGDAEYHQIMATELGKIEKDLATFYSKRTATDLEILKGFMSINEPLTPEQISTLGFATIKEHAFKAVAKFNINNKNDEMTSEDKSWIEKTFGALFAKHANIKALMVADADGKNLDFGTQIENPDQIAVGMDAKFEDGTIPSGDVVLPGGPVLTFDEKGVITAITQKVEEGGEDMEALKAELEAAKAELETLKSAQAKAESDFQAKLKNIKGSMKTEFMAMLETREDSKEEKKPENRVSGLKEKMK